MFRKNATNFVVLLMALNISHSRACSKDLLNIKKTIMAGRSYEVLNTKKLECLEKKSICHNWIYRNNNELERNSLFMHCCSEKKSFLRIMSYCTPRFFMNTDDKTLQKVTQRTPKCSHCCQKETFVVGNHTFTGRFCHCYDELKWKIRVLILD